MNSLQPYKKDNPFRVPENYLEELNGRILQNTSERPTATKIRTLAMIRPWLSLAAIIAGVAVLTMAVLHLSGGGYEKNIANNEALADIPQFLIDGIDMYMLELQMQDGIENNETAGANQHNDIIEYLMLNEIDFAMLYEHLDEISQL